MRPTFAKSNLSILHEYPLLLRELNASAVAGLMVAFTVVGMWLVVSPSIYLLLALVAIAISILIASYIALHLILHPPRSPAQLKPSDLGLSHWEDIGFRARDGVELGAWFIPPGPQADGTTLIFLHGMSANRSELLREAAMLAAHGYGALLLDLRNHGRSARALTTIGYREVEDVWGAVAYLSARPEVNAERVGVFGYSMGAVTALRAAAQIPQIRAVVAQSAFTSLDENIEAGIVSHGGLPPIPFVPLVRWLGEHTTGLQINQVRPIDDVAKISPRAVLFIHGKRDAYVSADNSRRLYAAAYEPKALYLVNQGDHKTIMQTEPEAYEAKVSAFLKRHLLEDRSHAAQERSGEGPWTLEINIGGN